MPRTRRRKTRRRRRRRGGRVHTRGARLRALKSYRRHRRASHCRGKRVASCAARSGCKVARGRKRTFCRKTRNTRRRRR